MTEVRRRRRSYDPRLRQLVREGRGDNLARRLKIPRTTIAGWKRSSTREIVSAESMGLGGIDPHLKVAELERRVRTLTMVLGLLLMLVRVSRARLDGKRLPDGDDKAVLLRAVERARSTLPLRSVLRMIGLSATRYWVWKRTSECTLDDEDSCPKSRPMSLTPNEVNVLREMTTAPEYRHVSTSTLAILAQRLGRVFAAPATWCRYVRDRGWRRPRKRVHPVAPKEGIRASEPDELWHADTTVVRLLDGSKVYLRAVIDNYSRRILAWWLGASPEPATTAALSLEAANAADGAPVEAPQSVMVDGGTENFNKAVDELVNDGVLKRILAQTDIAASNSMIEAFFRLAKHNWLFLHNLDTIETVRRLVEFYVNEHNSRLPHRAHRGRTPDEVYFGRESDVPDKLAKAQLAARIARLETIEVAGAAPAKRLRSAFGPIRQATNAFNWRGRRWRIGTDKKKRAHGA